MAHIESEKEDGQQYKKKRKKRKEIESGMCSSTRGRHFFFSPKASEREGKKNKKIKPPLIRHGATCLFDSAGGVSWTHWLRSVDMDGKEFRQRGREMVDYIAEYMESVGERRVTPAVEPGYLRDLIPKEAPHKGQKWDEIMSDIEDKIMPGVSLSSIHFLSGCLPSSFCDSRQ